MSTDADLLTRAREIDLLASLRTNNKGLIEASLSNLIAMLSAETRWRFCLNGYGPIWIAPAGTAAWRRLTEDDMIEMRETLEHEYRFAHVGKGNFRDALRFVAKRGTP